MSVVVSDLVKIYKTQNAVNHISFQAGKGEILGFLGPNGAGKSTTCYIPPTSGTITVCGFDVTESPLDVRKHIGYLPEHNPLYLDMYVHEYLQFIGSLHKLKGIFLTNRVKEMVELCGLTIEQNKKIGALSKGYRQRVGLAQSLIHDPEVLILDEPTTGLDPNQIVEIRNVIRNVGKEKTVVFSTHIMQEVQALCSRVVIINSGIIVADSSVEKLTTMQSNSRTITAEFEREIDAELLRKINGVKDVKPLGNGRYELTTDADIRNEVFRLAADQNWPLQGLKQEENSLENIFRQLTGKKGEEDA